MDPATDFSTLIASLSPQAIDASSPSSNGPLDSSGSSSCSPHSSATGGLPSEDELFRLMGGEEGASAVYGHHGGAIYRSRGLGTGEGGFEGFGKQEDGTGSFDFGLGDINGLPAIDPYFLQSTHITDNPSSLSSLGSLTSGSHSDDSNFNNVSYDTSNDMSNFDPSLFNGLGFDFDESTGPTFDQNGLQQRQSSSFQPPPPTIPSFVLQHMHNNPNFLQQAQPYSQSSTAHVHPPPPPSYPTQQPNQPGTSSQIPFTFETQPPTPQQTSFQFAPSAFSFSQHPEPASSHHSTTTNPISSGPAKRKLSRISQDPPHQDPSSDTFATQSVESAAASKFVSIKPKPSTSSPKKKDSLEPPPPSSSSRTRPPPDHNAIERKYRDNIADGFTRLRDCVPVLRVLFKSSTSITESLDTPDPQTGLIDGMLPETKQGKATVLGAAREYVFLLQRERARLSREVEFLEGKLRAMGVGEEWREEFAYLDRQTQLDPYLASITYNDTPSSPPSSDSPASSKPPPKKRAKAVPRGKATVAKDGAKALMGVGLGVGVFGTGELMSFGSGGSKGVVIPVEGGGRVIGRMAKRGLEKVGSSRLEEHSHVVEWAMVLLLGAVVVWLLLPVLRRVARLGRRAFVRAAGVAGSMLRYGRRREGQERRKAELSIVVRQEEEGSMVDEAELKRIVGFPEGVVGCVYGISWEWTRAQMGWISRAQADEELAELSVQAWEKLACLHLALPTDLSSYFQALLISLTLQNLLSSLPFSPPPSSPASTLHARAISTLAFLSIALSGGEVTPAATTLWRQAQDAAPQFVSSFSPSSDESHSLSKGARALTETLQLSLLDVLSTCNPILRSFDFPPPAPPIETVASLLSMQDVLQILRHIFLLVAPNSSPTSPSSSSSLFLLESTAPVACLSPPSISPKQRTALASQVTVALATSLPETKEREVALACMGVFGLLVGGREEARKVVIDQLKNLPVLGRAGRAVLSALGGAEAMEAAGDDIDDLEENEEEEEASLEREINDLVIFLLSYDSVINSLPTPTTTSSPIKISSSTTINPTLLAQTLTLRSLLASPSFAFRSSFSSSSFDSSNHSSSPLALESVFEDDESAAGQWDDAKERFSDALYGLGRLAAGWGTDVGLGGGHDSGFEEGGW